MIAVLLGLHLVAAVLAPAIATRIGSRAFLLCAIPPAAVFAWAVGHATGVLGGTAVTGVLPWVEGLGLDLAVRMDAFSLLMVLLVSGIGVLLFTYAVTYFRGSAKAGRAAAGLTAFAGAMLGLVLADNLLLLYVFWELTSVTSYLLVGLDDTNRKAREAAQHALVVTVAGGLAMLAGFLLLGQAAGTFSLSGLLADPPATSGLAQVGFLLTIAGVMTKSAQVPFHGWLPGAMAAPTPVSAYLHSATMVKAGVYLAARLAPVAAAGVVWQPLLVTVGAITMIHGAIRALRQHDLKLLLAYATVSQLGLMVLLFGSGIPALTYAGVAVLVAHALYKATLFMVVGLVDSATGTRDIRRLSGLARRLPPVGALALVAGGSLLGLPPLFGFVAKEAALDGLLLGDMAMAIAVTAAVALGAALTVAYGLRFLVGGFARAAGEDDPGRAGPRAGWSAADGGGPHPDGLVPDAEVRAPTAFAMAPAALLAGLTLLLGVLPALGVPLLEAAAVALDADASGKLVLWPGLKPALGVSVASILLGIGLWVAWRRVEPTLRLPALPGADDVFRQAVAASVRGASRVTATVQHGSQPVYLAVILLTAVAMPAAALLAAPADALPTPSEVTAGLTADPLQVVVALLVVGAGIGTAAATRRLPAVLLLGAVGYGMSVLFLLQGAPDLALTQLVIESLVVLIFVVVLRLLPREFTPVRARFGARARLAVSVTVGVGVAGMLLLAQSVGHPDPVSVVHLERALPDGGGRNVVNVILTDFRALDTLGEITVLLVCGLGVASLVAVGRGAPSASQVDLPAPGRSLILETGVRAAFPLIAVYSTYLFFAGHNSPGGGFVAGLVAGAALLLRALVGGTPALRRIIRVSPTALMGVGVTIGAGTGALGWLWGGAFLETTIWEAHLPVLGTVKATSALPFDLGVFLVVVGFVVTLLETVAADPVQGPDADKGGAADADDQARTSTGAAVGRGADRTPVGEAS